MDINANTVVEVGGKKVSLGVLLQSATALGIQPGAADGERIPVERPVVACHLQLGLVEHALVQAVVQRTRGHHAVGAGGQQGPDVRPHPCAGPETEHALEADRKSVV